MGGAGNLGSKIISGKANIGDFGRIALAATSGGAAELGYAAKRTSEGMATPAKTLADNMGLQQREQADQAAKLEQQEKERPQTISPDDFLAKKAKQVANLRLGLASTITGVGASPSPILSAPALTGSGGSGKKTLGS
jgi:hypothetical protein